MDWAQADILSYSEFLENTAGGAVKHPHPSSRETVRAGLTRNCSSRERTKYYFRYLLLSLNRPLFLCCSKQASNNSTSFNPSSSAACLNAFLNSGATLKFSGSVLPLCGLPLFSGAAKLPEGSPGASPNAEAINLDEKVRKTVNENLVRGEVRGVIDADELVPADYRTL